MQNQHPILAAKTVLLLLALCWAFPAWADRAAVNAGYFAMGATEACG